MNARPLPFWLKQVMLSILNFVLKNCCFTEAISLAALCHSEVTSLAKPYYSEVTSLVRSHCPEVTRPVEGMKFCFCGGRYVRGACERDDCPRARLGYGSWHAALPRLQELWSQDQLADSYPHLNLSTLQDHVEVNAEYHRGKRERTARWKRFMEQRRARRQPRQPDFPPPDFT